MRQFFCHPVLFDLLQKSKVESICQNLMSNIIIISDYISKESHQIHEGIQKAVHFRLTSQSHYIIIISFYSKEELIQKDLFGILSLTGTVYVRIPFFEENLLQIVNFCINNELKIPDCELNNFSTFALKVILKEKINILKHGGDLDIVNRLTGPLRVAALGSSSFPELIEVVRIQLKSLKSYIAKDEIVEIITLINNVKTIQDEYLNYYLEFTNGLKQLDYIATNDVLNIEQLIIVIDKLNENSLKIQIQ